MTESAHDSERLTRRGVEKLISWFDTYVRYRYGFRVTAMTTSHFLHDYEILGIVFLDNNLSLILNIHFVPLVLGPLLSMENTYRYRYE